MHIIHSETYNNKFMNYALEYNISQQQKIEQASDVLFNCYGIKFLIYKKVLANGNMVCIINHPAWRDFIFHNKIWISNSFDSIANEILSKGRYDYIWPRNPNKNDLTYGSMFEYKINNGITMFKIIDNVIETFSFYSDSDVLNFYLNEIFILDRFILYFKDKLYDVINNYNKNILIPTHVNINNYKTSIKQEKYKLFMQKTESKNLYTVLNGKEICFSRGEMNCMKYLIQGKSVKQTAQLMSLSPRTIHAYIYNAKDKINISSTTKLKEYILGQI